MENQQIISNDYSITNKLIVTPKTKIFYDDIFDFDGTIDLVRIFYSKVWHTPFKYIQIAGKTFAWIPSTAPPSNMEDFPFSFEFKKGDKFVIAHAFDIEKIELFYNNSNLNISKYDKGRN